ncbi:DUF3710 domain-containing protein [Corynebacterium uberis]|uniref:DUF3710 domain-containing protein n=1 Tax=Corynebacterium TaxID=1716 RepID=UPI001D09C514|nr:MULTISPECIES: DUF3710 domain-containing protein [Corynebacterium]MCZ9308521.1 DUF3710 domain-containing protein [Corynebacterium sp. c6VSa_13]UDL74174.1 DUF3710 domain-containing protein [Corynebacterium uberis]UDL74942.1 DUF3710 domain-containing protein [Corynebacterium uberis]UDL77157.1 DUF3710 domain-containing protein [Corynebacterium uberis]UDL79439.1 DUF3710 domain-containing protein [Corynebacterium uberis]
MGLWPFGKKDKADGNDEAVAAPNEYEQDGSSSADNSAHNAHTGYADNDSAVAASAAQDGQPGAEEEPAVTHDAVNGTTGPFDGDQVAIEDFDFSDFSNGVLNLGSLKLPLPKESQIQVEMGEEGPRMLHVVTRYGRITPVAFAAPTSTAQWRQAVSEIMEKMTEDGLNPQIEDGPWGREVVARGTAGIIRLIGADGPRWMLRFTLAGPLEMADELTEQGRQLVARTFVYRGDDPILAGNSLPVTLPQQLVEQVNQALQQRAAQQQQQQQQPEQAPAPGQPQIGPSAS